MNDTLQNPGFRGCSYKPFDLFLCLVWILHILCGVRVRRPADAPNYQDDGVDRVSHGGVRF